MAGIVLTGSEACKVSRLTPDAAHNDVLKLYPRKLFARVMVYRRSNLSADPQYRGARQAHLFISKTLIRSDKGCAMSSAAGGLNVEVS